MRTRAFTILTILAGISAGAGLSVFLSAAGEPRHAGAPGAAAAVPAPAAGAHTSLAVQRLEHQSRTLGERLHDMEQRLGERTGGEPDDRSPEERARDDEEATELAREQIRHEMEARFSAHEQAPVDQTWASTASAKLERQLAALGDSPAGGATLAAVDCRAGSCLATVDFSSYAAALTGYSAYTTHFYDGINCAIAAAIEPPADPQATCAVKLLFHECS